MRSFLSALRRPAKSDPAELTVEERLDDIEEAIDDLKTDFEFAANEAGVRAQQITALEERFGRIKKVMGGQGLVVE